MSIDRTTLRTVVPPILALGLVALVSRPLPADTDPDLGATATRTVTAATAATVPHVSFQNRIRIVEGRLHTAVLVSAAQPAGRALVTSIPGCVVALRPGVVGQLDCAYAGSGSVTIDVALADGQHVTHTAVPVVG